MKYNYDEGDPSKLKKPEDDAPPLQELGIIYNRGRKCCHTYSTYCENGGKYSTCSLIQCWPYNYLHRIGPNAQH